MIDTKPQMYTPPRSERDLSLLIESQLKIVAELVDLAVEFHNVDVRPLIYDGESVHRIGPDPVPINLKMAIQQEQLVLAEFKHELYRRHQMEHP